MTDLQPLWVLVHEFKRLAATLQKVPGTAGVPQVMLGEWFRDVATELEQQLRLSMVPELTSTPGEEEPDNINAYDYALRTLRESAKAFDELSDLGGHHLSRKNGSKAKVHARRCGKAALMLEKAGEL